jgi:methyl-accepting chemotaxis protein
MLNFDISVGKKIGFGFATMLLLIVIILGISIYSLSSAASKFSQLIENENVIVSHTYAAKIALLEARRTEKDLLYANDEILTNSANKFITELHAELGLASTLVIKTRDTKLTEVMPRLIELSDSYKKNFLVMSAAPVGQERMIAALNLRKTAKALEKTLGDFLESVSSRIQNETAVTQSYTRSISNFTLFTGIVALSIGILLVVVIPRSITRPLNNMQRLITEIEKSRDLTIRISESNHDEVGKTADAFNKLMSVLQETLREILNNVGKVSEAAEKLSLNSNHVAASSDQQSEASNRMAATVEEVTSSIHQVSESARLAQSLSTNTGALSDQGGEIIHHAAGDMQEISNTVTETSSAIENLSKQSSKISSVVQVIKDLADQTNLLALNAAIEAARAGEQGRGFAVVADEVRKLAESTTRSTEEIRSVIGSIQSTINSTVISMGNTVSQVNAGVVLANQAGDSINKIKDSTAQVINVINDISNALVEQSSASNDIATNVELVAQMSETNRSSIHETARASDRLKELAENMRSSVAQFRI